LASSFAGGFARSIIEQSVWKFKKDSKINAQRPVRLCGHMVAQSRAVLGSDLPERFDSSPSKDMTTCNR